MTACLHQCKIFAHSHLVVRGVIQMLLLFVSAIGIALTTACAEVATVDEQALKVAFPYIQNGTTEKQDLVDRFGPPVHAYQGGQIISYFAHRKEGTGVWSAGPMRVGQSFGERYALMLVFGPDDILERHSLVRER